MRKAAAPPPPPSLQSHNGSGSLSAEDSDSLSGESLEGSMELGVILPDGRVYQTSVEKRTPMMDLLVQVTKANGLSPGSFVLDMQRERSRNSLLYKPNTPVGSLNASILYVVPKSSVRDAPIRKDSKTGAQPFEKTFRLRVHLPRNQLHVLRVSQSTPLIDIFNVICSERELNSERYELRHPVHTEERLDPQRCLADYCLSEVAIVSVKGPTSVFSHSSSDIMALQQDDDRKKRFFGFMFKKSKSISKSIGDNSSDGHSSRGVSPARSDGSGTQSISPPPSTVGHSRLNGASSSSTVNNNNNNNKLSKKRPAPPPPKAGVTKSISQSPVPASFLEEHKNIDTQTASSHSRHSSDSSGYHEASILSESPETTVHDLVAPSDYKAAIPSAKKTLISTNLTTVDSNSSLSVSSGQKKRKAPAPPPVQVENAVAENVPAPMSTSTVLPPADDSGMMEINEISSCSSETVTPKDAHLSSGKNAQRSDSLLSHASSSSSEELKEVSTKVSTKAVTVPVPLPRQSKTPPVMCRTVVNEDKAMEKISETPVQASGDVEYSQNDILVNESDKRLNSEDVNCDPQPRPNHSLPNKTDTVSETADENVVHLNTENNRRSSNSSKDSDQCCPKKSVVDESSVDQHSLMTSEEILPESNSKPCNWTLTKESHEAEVIAALRKMSVESQSSSDSTDDTEIAVIQASGNIKKYVSENNVENVNDLHGESYGASCETEKLSVSSEKDESSLPNSVNSSRKSSTHSETDVEISEALNTELCVVPGTKDSDECALDESMAQSDLFSCSEQNNTDVLELDLKTSPKNDVSAENLLDNRNCHQSSSSLSGSVNISSKPSKMQQERDVKETDVIALNARIDQTISENKIAAEIDEAFASIDIMDSGSDNDDERPSPSDASSSDPVITWDYNIPEVPRQFQNDFDDEGPKQTSANSFQHSSDLSKEKTVTKSPPKSATGVDKEIATKQNQRSKENVPNAETSASKNVAVEKEIDVQIRRVYRKPVVNFSISTYKTRDEEEVRYGHKLTKADSFSQKPVLTNDSPASPNVSKVETVALSVSMSLNKPKAAHLVSGQSSTITRSIASGNDSPGLQIVDRVEIRDIKPEGGMRKAKSEVHLNSQTGNNLTMSNGFITEQERLQQEYLKLHQQFLQWQQQLLQNQTILQQQQILPESSTETLQRIQQLQQQLMSLPLQSTLPVSQEQPAAASNADPKDYSQKTRSLPRPRAATTSNSTTSNGNSNSLERRLPRVGPRPWRPVTVSVSSWNQRPAEVGQDEINKQFEKPIQIITSEDTRQSNGSSVSSDDTRKKEVPRPVYSGTKNPSLNSFNNDKSASVVSRTSTQVPAFRRYPVVKGFATEPQQKSKVLINSAKDNQGVNGRATLSSVSQPNGFNSKPGAVNANLSPKVVSLNSDKFSTSKNSKDIANNTLSSRQSKTEPVYFGGPPTKPSVQTVTYFGDKLESTTNKIGVGRGTESAAVHKVANNVSLSKPKSYNFGSDIYNAETTDKSIDKKFTTVVNLTKQKSSKPVPPPLPAQVPPIIISHQTNVIKPANGTSKKSPTSPNANGDFKDELMMAIREFGGRSGLKKVSSSETHWENRYGKVN